MNRKLVAARAAGLVIAAAVMTGNLVGQAPSDPIAVALMTGFNPGANPGMGLLNTKLQAAFGGGAGGAPSFSSQVFAFSATAAASTYLQSFGPTAKLVLIGHSLGAEANFAVAQTLLGPVGLDVDLQVSFDYVAVASPFAATIPTKPPQIVKALNYYQVSTAFLEPVPSNTINGAARNLNMEVMFGDSTLAHTSVDCDDRVHQLVIERIRELFQPAPFPGTGEDLDLFCRIDTLNTPCVPASGNAVAGVLTQRSLQPIAAGQWVTLRTISPTGAYNGSLFGVLGEVYTTGMTPVPSVAGLSSSLNPAGLILLTPSSIQSPPATFDPLAPTGFAISFCWPAGLTGASFLIQTVAIAPAAANGLFASSLGMELRAI